MTLYIALIIIPLLLGFWAQSQISRSYNKYIRIPSRGGISGVEAAQAVMNSFGIYDVKIEQTPGHLTDHYDPTNKCLRLSKANYQGTSLAALGVAAHEAGHAIQHKVGYKALQWRMSLIPVTNLASKLLPFVVIGGFIFGMLGLIKVGVLVYLVLTLFQLITLPVEFDASRRAKQQLVGLGILDRDEMPGVHATLDAAAWTYVAAFVATLGNLVYMLLLARDRE